MALSDEQLALRAKGIGASEIPAILGLSRFETLGDVFRRKTGGQEPFTGNEHTFWGERLESVIAGVYAERRPGVTLQAGTTCFAEGKPFFCTPDFHVLGAGEPYLLQIKNTSYSMKAKWKLGPPPTVQAQVQWEMMVMGMDRDDVAVLIGGNEYRECEIYRHEEAITQMAAIGEWFWSHVEAGELPDVSEIADSKAWLKDVLQPGGE